MGRPNSGQTMDVLLSRPGVAAKLVELLASLPTQMQAVACFAPSAWDGRFRVRIVKDRAFHGGRTIRELGVSPATNYTKLARTMANADADGEGFRIRCSGKDST